MTWWQLSMLAIGWIVGVAMTAQFFAMDEGTDVTLAQLFAAILASPIMAPFMLGLAVLQILGRAFGWIGDVVLWRVSK